MAKKINVLDNTDNVELWFETKEGKKLEIPYYFLNRIDLQNLILYSEKETKDFPTLDELVRNKILFLKKSYIEVTLQYKTHPSKISIKKIQSFFKKHGFNVTEEAIMHNFNAYWRDLKSGFRDEENGYFLFTPCLHNNLSFNLTSLNKNCDWQMTYMC